MDQDDEGTGVKSDRSWTRIEGYITNLNCRRIAARRRAKVAPRTEPQRPDLLLSTLPYVALAIALAVIAASVIVLAWPGGH